jgi:hypothetical protein
MDEQQGPSTENNFLEQRVRELEERLALLTIPVLEKPVPMARVHPFWTLSLGLAGLAVGYFGLGIPQHYYQPLFAALVLAAGYHRLVWQPCDGGWRWPLVIINFLTLCLLFKLLIGGGISYPFQWMQVPSIGAAPVEEGASWFSRAIPQVSIVWTGVPGISDWHFDLTQVQTLLLMATVVGAMFNFQPFASFTAVMLLLISIPTLAEFNWDWVIPFLVLGGITLYLQTVPLKQDTP